MSDIQYINTCEVEFKGKKPKDSWMANWTLDQRLDKFFEFCRVFDDRQDSLLKDEYQIFSHRLHWHQHPFCDRMQSVTNNELRLFYTLVFSFSNEHWGTLNKLINEGTSGAHAHFQNNRHARNDLFQIYYPKGTNVKEWLLSGPYKAAKFLADDLLGSVERGERGKWTMMGFAKALESYFKEHQNFRSPLYPCKNTARYIAMAYPHLVDPESILFGGTGFFDGLHQLFGGENLNGKVKYKIDENGMFIPQNKKGELWLEQMNIVVNDPRNPMREQKWLNCEDKLCFWWKHISITHGAKKATKQIPYTWIFSDTFNLANRAEFLDEIKAKNLMYEEA
jgi:hypothetical protein